MTFSQCQMEPSLEAVLSDPIVRLLMARDRVSEEDLLRTIAATQKHLDRDRAWRGMMSGACVPPLT